MSSIIQIKKITYQEVNENINELLDMINYVDGAVNIDNLLNLLDMKVIEKNIDIDNVIASLDICDFYRKKYNNSKIVFIDDKYNSEIQRFCIAGLISDYIYNYNNEPSYRTTKGYYVDRTLFSKLSNYFALSLLMPIDVFRKKYYEFKENSVTDSQVADKLSLYFNVPYMKVEERLTYFLKQEQAKAKVLEYKKI